MRGLTRIGLVLAALLLVGCPRPRVVRVVDGVEVNGRFIGVAAYAEYARGAWAESHGDSEQALQAYRSALSRDAESVELWTRVGAMSCAKDEELADDAFASAQNIDAAYAPLWRARGTCAAQRGDNAAALAFAQSAFRYDSSDQRIVLTFAERSMAAGHSERAGVALQEWVVVHPADLDAWKLLERWAVEAGRDAWAVRAREQLSAIQTERNLEQRPTRAFTAIDDALARGEIDRAWGLARQINQERALATRALLVAQPTAAHHIAGTRLGAEPEDSSARVMVAAAVDLGARPGDVAKLVAVPDDATAVDELGKLWLAELLARHVGLDAARVWLGRDVPDRDAIRRALRGQSETR